MVEFWWIYGRIMVDVMVDLWWIDGVELWWMLWSICGGLMG